MGKYIEQNLYEGEYIVEKAHRDAWELFWKWVPGVLFCFLIAPLIWAIVETVIFKSTELVLTNRRLIFKRGILRKKTKDIPLPKVKGVSIDVPFWGRVFNWGDIYIDTEYGTMKYRIQDAEDFRTTVVGQIDQFERDRMAEQSAWMAQALLRGMNNQAGGGRFAYGGSQYGSQYGGQYGSHYGGQYGGQSATGSSQSGQSKQPVDPYGGYGRDPFSKN